MDNPIPATAYFTSPRPPALGLPHLITALDAELIGKASHLTGSKPGLWNIPALFDENDQFDDTRETAPLAAWALPLNQSELQGLRWYVAEAVFGCRLMIVDSAADETILNALAPATGHRLDGGGWVTDGFEDLAALPTLLDRIGWALIPIGPERARGLFVTTPTDAPRVAKLREWTDRQGRNSATLVESGQAVMIAEQAAPPTERANAIAHRIDNFLGELETFFGALDPALGRDIEQRIQFRRQFRQRIAQARNTRSS